jgi:hypothetical protein
MKIIRHSIKEPLELHELEVGKTYLGTNWHSHGELITPLETNYGNSETNRYFVFGAGELNYDVVEEEKSLYTEVDVEVHIYPILEGK